MRTEFCDNDVEADAIVLAVLGDCSRMGGWVGGVLIDQYGQPGEGCGV